MKVKELASRSRSWAAAKVAGVAALGMAGASAMATPLPAIDVTDLATGITNQLVPIGTIGLAVLGVVLAVKTYKWIKRAF